MSEEKSKIKVSVLNTKPPEGWYKNYLCLYDGNLHNFNTISHSVSKWLEKKFENHDEIYIEDLDGESDLACWPKMLYVKRINISLNNVRAYPNRYSHLINLTGKSLEELDLLVYKDKLIEFDGEIEIQEGHYWKQILASLFDQMIESLSEESDNNINTAIRNYLKI